MLNSDKFRELQLVFREYRPGGRIQEHKIAKNRKFKTACVSLSDSYTREELCAGFASRNKREIFLCVEDNGWNLIQQSKE